MKLVSKNLIIIFTRNPELGKVKTRLAKTVGDQSALKIYQFLLNHTQKIVKNINADKAVYYSIKVRENDMWNHTIYQKYLQIGDDLGIKMQHAFESAFQKNYQKVIIVGSDLYDLQPKHIKLAFKNLDHHDVVMGPAKDGGYYLLGMKTLYPKVFKNKDWGTETVQKNTLHDLQNETVFLLEELNDIDTYEDMKENTELKKLIKK
ncbi:MAG: TIGR04282 family arsenosugar biosynthesis glycosyltransferase [Flavobacteriales bacterium]